MNCETCGSELFTPEAALSGFCNAGCEAMATVDGQRAQINRQTAENKRLLEALRLRRQEEWHDEDGCVIWWGDREEAFQSTPWYIGSPLDDSPNGCVFSSDAVWLPIPEALEGGK